MLRIMDVDSLKSIFILGYLTGGSKLALASGWALVEANIHCSGGIFEELLRGGETEQTIVGDSGDRSD
jgi:hypothetical protein